MRKTQLRLAVRPLLVLHPNSSFQERLRALVGREYSHVEVQDWETLEREARLAPPSTVVVVDPYFGAAAGLAPALRVLLVDFPSTAVVAAVVIRPERAQDVRTLGTWGVAEIISIGHDDTEEAMLARLRRVHGRKLKELLARLLTERLSGRASAILDVAAEVAVSGGNASDLAQSLGFSRRTLLRRTSKAGLPPTRRLLAWLRILLAAELLDDPGRTVFDVARTLGYSSDSGLRRATENLVGASPTTMRTRGAAAAAAKGFIAELRRYNSQQGEE